MSIDKKIEQRVNKAKAGTIFLAEDFKELGTQSAIHTALHRMDKRGIITRIAQGIYAKPKWSTLLKKEVLPTADEVAVAIARRDKARILPSGSYALHILGLSAQIPLKLVYYTDGKTRTLQVGKRSIQFRKTTPKKLALKGEISRLVVQALSEIGHGNVTQEEEEKIIKLLKKEDIKDLKHDMALAPVWMTNIMGKALQK